jgi:hypothetical protein
VNATYKTGNNLDFTVSFSKVVNVTGTPRIPLTVGSSTLYATYVSGSGSANLLFRYSVIAGDVDTDGLSTSSPLDLNGGAIKDSANLNAGLIFTPPATSGVLVDGVDPVISNVVAPTNKTYILGENLTFVVNYTSEVNVTGTPKLSLSIGGNIVGANYLSGTGTSALTFSYSVQGGDYDNDGITLTSPVSLNGGNITDPFGDSAGMSFTVPNTTGILVDGVVPSITSVAGPSSGLYYLNNNHFFSSLYYFIFKIYL